MLKILFSSLLMIFITQSSDALAAWEVNDCAPGALDKPAECQYRVLSLTPAPTLAKSLGIRLDNGVNHVLFNNYPVSTYPTIGPRFVSNTSGSDIFIPQATADEFKSFLEAPTPGVVKKYAVAPRTYTATPSLCPGMTPSSVFFDVPASLYSTNPVVVVRYTPVVDENNPITTKTTVTPSTVLRNNAYLVFTLTRNDCSTDAQSNGPYCVLAKFREQQTLVFSAQGIKPSFSWGNPVVTRVFTLSKNNGAYLPVANCNSVAPPINGSCGSSNGKTLSSIPATTTLCAYGNPTAVSESGSWTWSCLGVSGGTTANCSAQKTVVPVCTPTACKTCNSSGALVNVANETRCIVGGGVWTVTSTKAGWCYNGVCRAYFFDDCSKTKNYVTRCFKANVKSNRTIGTYEERSCSSCTINTENDSCTSCRDIWGSGRVGQWDHNVNFD
ncbi:MAG: hypothetical protein RBT70_09015 [Alphaproteobacteria bacterium]|nr:hypothetical protein [Alphaproteobacteria bacterium]